MVADRYLHFGVARPHRGRAFLWPVQVWKVLYPSPVHLKLNLFQQAILGLARARCQDSAEMARLLGLDRELVAFIIATQLIPNGWMTSLGAVTASGQQLLEETQDASEEMRMGYAYQDAISGNWLPRFTNELAEIEAKRNDDHGYPIFLRDLNSGKEDRPFRLRHLKKGALDIQALFEAYRRYRNDHQHAKQRDDELPSQIRIDSLSFVEDSAQPMWVWTWIFPDQVGPHPWLLADPFGLQAAASWLRKPLQEELPRNQGLARYIAEAIGEVKPTNMSAKEWLQSLENQVDLILQADYSWSSKVPLIGEFLTIVLRRKTLLASKEGFWQEDVTSLLIEMHNLVESVLQWLLQAYPADLRRLPHWKVQQDWKDGQAQHYLEFFSLPCLTEDVIKRLSRQRLDQVRTAVKQGNSSLKGLLFAGLLATVDQVDHPFRKLSADELRLGRLLDMADARNKKAGHAGGERINREDAMEYAEFIIKWIQIFKDWY